MKKQISPVVTVIVILVVVVVVALLWNFFTSGGGSSSSRGRGGGGMSLNIDMKKADMETARKNAAKARDKVLGQIKESAGGEKGGE